MKRRNKILIAKTLMLVALLVITFVVTGCAAGTGQVAWSGATIENGALFVGSLGRIAAIDTANGNFLWDKTLETEGSSGGFGCAIPASKIPIYGSTAVAGELVYVGGADGKVYAFTIDTGASRWVYPRSGNLGAVILGGTVVNQDIVYVCTVAGDVYALDVVNGDYIWDYDIGEDVWATPAVADNTLYIGTFDKNVYAIDINTGEEKWQHPFETGGPIISSVVIDGDVLYIASFDRHIYALNKESGEPIWQYPDVDGGEENPEKWFWASPVLCNGSIYAANMDGKVYVIDAGSGGLVTAIDLGAAISSTPVAVGDEVFVATEEGRVYSINTTSLNQEIMRDLELRIIAPLAVDDNIVYIHTQEKEAIYAMNSETGTIIWDTPMDIE
ncbi:MAG TPA: PQQ-binding-like beta-propeller repeat protein [Dehalococcoidia bacterium]|nr:PQQ-binding-like beta-propeller repeat protein [Dehalococcoidia bacterium]